MQGKTALITGGSRGIGRAVALRLAGAGAYAVINYIRNDAAAEETLRLIRAAGGNGEIRRFDVSAFYETQEAVNGIVAARGRLDILVNNAGTTADGLIVRIQEEDWDRLIDTNLKGVFNCCRAVIRQMMKQRWGRIINIASVVAEAGNAGQSAYSAAKAGVLGLTKSLARELAARNICVNAVSPGLIDTEMIASLSEKSLEEVLKQIPLGRTGRPEEAMARHRAVLRAARRRDGLVAALVHAGLILGAAVSVYPLARIFSVSLRPGDRIISTDLSLIPAGANLSAYGRVLGETSFLLWLWNSMVITCATSVLGVALAALGGYAFSRFRFPGHKAGLTFLLGNQMIPCSMLLLPLFLMIMKLGLVNTYLGMIIAYSVTSLPFSIWILKGYYDTIPRSLEEAAMVDGTTRFGAFVRVILPLSTPALAIAFLFNFTQAWNEYLVARVVLTDARMYTWTLGLFELQGQYLTQWGMFAAASIMVTIPVLGVFLYSSKWLVSGLTLGGVKG